MDIHYGLDPAVVLDEAQGPELFKRLRKAGVNKIWLWGFFYGKLWSPVEKMVQAREVLQRYGFEVGVVQLPVGHPGNSLNPDDDTLELQIPSHWRYRIDSSGNPVYYCADIEENMIRDNAASITLLRDAGFTSFFMDDDLRLGLWGSQIEGCYCDECMTEFNARHNRNESRESLARTLDARSDAGLVREWLDYNCSKVTRLMEAMMMPGIELGIMVMHLGDERHGIDVAGIGSAIPDCMFRVGEAHFGDAQFGAPEGKASELFSILLHLNGMGRERTYSETTVFPSRALSPQNLNFKAQLAVAAGIPHLFLMSGTWLITEDYWEAFAAQLPVLERLDRECGNCDRRYPIHVAYGTKCLAEAEGPYVAPLVAGLPAKPVRGGENGELGEILLLCGDYELTPEWERQFASYRTILIDRKAAERNRDILTDRAFPHVRLLDYETGATSAEEETVLLREALGRETVSFPYVIEGNGISLFWIEEKESVILLNLKEEASNGILDYRGARRRVALKPLETVWLPLQS